MAPVMVGNSLPINKRLKELLVGFKWEHMAAGVSGGVMSTLVLHPLDLVKIRFQGELIYYAFLTTYFCLSDNHSYFETRQPLINITIPTTPPPSHHAGPDLVWRGGSPPFPHLTRRGVGPLGNGVPPPTTPGQVQNMMWLPVNS